MGIKTAFNPMGALPHIGGADPYPEAIFVTRHTLASNQLAYTTPSITLSAGGPFSIDWGDGTRDNYSTGGAKTHTFATADEYVVQIIDPNKHITAITDSPRSWRSVNFKFDVLKINSPSLTSLAYVFVGCLGITGSIPDISGCVSLINMSYFLNGYNYGGYMNVTGQTPDLSKLTNLVNIERVFCYCPLMTGSIPDMSKCTRLQNVFDAFACSGFTGEIPDFSKCHEIRNFNGTFYTSLGFTSVHPDFVEALSSKANIREAFPSLSTTNLTVGNCAASVRAVFPTTWGGTNVIS